MAGGRIGHGTACIDVGTQNLLLSVRKSSGNTMRNEELNFYSQGKASE